MRSLLCLLLSMWAISLLGGCRTGKPKASPGNEQVATKYTFTIRLFKTGDPVSQVRSVFSKNGVSVIKIEECNLSPTADEIQITITGGMNRQVNKIAEQLRNTGNVISIQVSR